MSRGASKLWADEVAKQELPRRCSMLTSAAFGEVAAVIRLRAVNDLMESLEWPPWEAAGEGSFWELFRKGGCEWLRCLCERIFGQESMNGMGQWGFDVQKSWMKECCDYREGPAATAELVELLHPLGRLMQMVYHVSDPKEVESVLQQARQQVQVGSLKELDELSKQSRVLWCPMGFNLFSSTAQQQLAAHWQEAFCGYPLPTPAGTQQGDWVPRCIFSASDHPIWCVYSGVSPLRTLPNEIPGQPRVLSQVHVTPFVYLVMRMTHWLAKSAELAGAPQSSAADLLKPERPRLTRQRDLVDNSIYRAKQFVRTGWDFYATIRRAGHGSQTAVYAPAYRSIGCVEAYPAFALLFDAWQGVFAPIPSQPILAPVVRSTGSLHYLPKECGSLHPDEPATEAMHRIFSSEGCFSHFASQFVLIAAEMWTAHAVDLTSSAVTGGGGKVDTPIGRLTDPGQKRCGDPSQHNHGQGVRAVCTVVMQPLIALTRAVQFQEFLRTQFAGSLELRVGDLTQELLLSEAICRHWIGWCTKFLHTCIGLTSMSEECQVQMEELPLMDMLGLWAAIISPYSPPVAPVPEKGALQPKLLQKAVRDRALRRPRAGDRAALDFIAVLHRCVCALRHSGADDDQVEGALRMANMTAPGALTLEQVLRAMAPLRKLSRNAFADLLPPLPCSPRRSPEAEAAAAARHAADAAVAAGEGGAAALLSGADALFAASPFLSDWEHDWLAGIGRPGGALERLGLTHLHVLVGIFLIDILLYFQSAIWFVLWLVCPSSLVWPVLCFALVAGLQLARVRIPEQLPEALRAGGALDQCVHSAVRAVTAAAATLRLQVAERCGALRGPLRPLLAALSRLREPAFIHLAVIWIDKQLEKLRRFLHVAAAPRRRRRQRNNIFDKIWRRLRRYHDRVQRWWSGAGPRERPESIWGFPRSPYGDIAVSVTEQVLRAGPGCGVSASAAILSPGQERERASLGNSPGGLELSPETSAVMHWLPFYRLTWESRTVIPCAFAQLFASGALSAEYASTDTVRMLHRVLCLLADERSAELLHVAEHQASRDDALQSSLRMHGTPAPSFIPAVTYPFFLGNESRSLRCSGGAGSTRMFHAWKDMIQPLRLLRAQRPEIPRDLVKDCLRCINVLTGLGPDDVPSPAAGFLSPLPGVRAGVTPASPVLCPAAAEHSGEGLRFYDKHMRLNEQGRRRVASGLAVPCPYLFSKFTGLPTQPAAAAAGEDGPGSDPGAATGPHPGYEPYFANLTPRQQMAAANPPDKYGRRRRAPNYDEVRVLAQLGAAADRWIRRLQDVVNMYHGREILREFRRWLPEGARWVVTEEALRRCAHLRYPTVSSVRWCNISKKPAEPLDPALSEALERHQADLYLDADPSNPPREKVLLQVGDMTLEVACDMGFAWLYGSGTEERRRPPGFYICRELPNPCLVQDWCTAPCVIGLVVAKWLLGWLLGLVTDFDPISWVFWLLLWPAAIFFLLAAGFLERHRRCEFFRQVPAVLSA
eukprot:TRINITY_DN490_c0_g1_i2.p1 TRINITY_DN490_c0_g1~~TRINITY_DN490_c0_g1_i2.p1  ORF type:complete len:1501 (+),score=453.00 TRINITY_DN490_c0_g1_i2:99-4601(+)